MALVSRLRRTQYARIGTLLIQHLADLSESDTIRKSGPNVDVFQALCSPELAIDRDLIDISRMYLKALYESRLGEDHVAVWELHLEKERQDLGDLTHESLDDLEHMIGLVDRRFGPVSRRALMYLAGICRMLAAAKRFAEAEYLRTRFLRRVTASKQEYHRNFVTGAHKVLGCT